MNETVRALIQSRLKSILALDEQCQRLEALMRDRTGAAHAALKSELRVKQLRMGRLGRELKALREEFPESDVGPWPDKEQ